MRNAVVLLEMNFTVVTEVMVLVRFGDPIFVR
jgi:hypothetical protein